MTMAAERVAPKARSLRTREQILSVFFAIMTRVGDYQPGRRKKPRIRSLEWMRRKWGIRGRFGDEEL